MKLSFRSAAATLAAIVASVAVALAAGNFSTYPIVGNPAFCSGNVIAGVPGTATVCDSNVPAGPAALTGNELIPADTGLPSGQQPQTVVVPARLLGGGATQFATPLTGASLTAAAGETTMLLDPAGTIAALTVTLPAVGGLIDGQKWRLASSQTVTALTLTPGSGTTIAQAPTTITVSTTAPYNYEFVYRASTTKWYRLQ